MLVFSKNAEKNASTIEKGLLENEPMEGNNPPPPRETM